MAEVKIMQASLKDFRDIQELCRQLCIKENREFDVTIDVNFPNKTNGKKYLLERIRNGCALIATDNKKIVGYLVGGINETEKYRSISRVGEIENMLVIEGLRGKGVGSKLIQEFIKWCKTKKARRIRVIASAGNSETIGFYKKKGFKEYNMVLECEIS